MNKKCIYCGAELAEEASFCPHCAKEQIEKSEVKMPGLWRKKSVVVIIATFAILIVALITKLPPFLSEQGIYHIPKTYEGTASLQYFDMDGEYELCIAFDQGLRRDGSGWFQAQDQKKTYKRGAYHVVFHRYPLLRTVRKWRVRSHRLPF